MLSIILPVYNEEDNIPYIEKELFPVLNKLHMKYEVIFVNDGSKDTTVEKIKELMKKRHDVKLYHHKKNRGLGAAIRTAIPRCRGELVVTLDTDLTFHPRQIPELLKRFSKVNADVVTGSPHLYGYDKCIPMYRRFLSKNSNFIYRIILGQKITAVSPIFRLYRTKDLQSLNLESSGFEINAEILAKLLLKGKKVEEIPVKLTARRYGKSKFNNIKEIRNHIRLITKMIFWRITK